MSRFHADQWVQSKADERRLFVVGVLTEGRLVVELNRNCVLRIVDEIALADFEHLPDCSGWDWVAPVPAPKVIDVDPGEGWRWLEKGEPVLEGDQWFSVAVADWFYSENWQTTQQQADGLCYRRRDEKRTSVRLWTKAGRTVDRFVFVAAENRGDWVEVKSDGAGGWYLEDGKGNGR